MNTLYITNKTDKPIQATISDSNTGNNVLKYELQPGPNEIAVRSLQTGVYFISLTDHNDEILYRQKLVQEVD